MPAQSNARLLKITAPGVDADWIETPGSAGTPKWEGSAPAYYTEKRERLVVGGDTDIVLRRTLILDNDLAEPIDNNDLLTFEYNGATQTARAQLIERRDLPELDPDVRTTRIELDAS